jgi:uncharacterized protein
MTVDSNFHNDNLGDMNDLSIPHVALLKLQPLAEQYAPLNLLINIMVTLLILTLGAFAYIQPWVNLPPPIVTFIPYALAMVTLISLVLIPLNFKRDKIKRYALRELDLHFSSGLIFKKLVSQPISRIQHVELKRGPLERYKNLATLQVFSAGGTQYTFEIPGLSIEKANHIHQFILQNKDLVQNA